MSLETQEWLNGGNILIGFDADTWWKDETLIARMGIESPFYPGAIPADEVYRRLLNFRVESFANASLRPMIDGWQGPSFPDSNGTLWRIVIDPTRQAIGPDDSDDTFGVFKAGYNSENHQYGEVLVEATAQLVDEALGDLGISTAGLLSGRAVAFLSIEMPETFKARNAELEFRSKLMAATSMNGTIATCWQDIATEVVCDNTLAAGIAEGVANGSRVTVRHTRNSGPRLSAARETLGLIMENATQFGDFVDGLFAVPVSNDQWHKVLDDLVPLPTEDGRGLTVARTKQEKLDEMYRSDTRCAPWADTAFGVLQTFNTYGQHVSIVRGEVHRAERNTLNVIHGKVEASDLATLGAMRRVGVLQAA